MIVIQKDLKALSISLGIDIVDLQKYDINTNAIKKIDINLAKKYNIIPIDLINSFIVVATNDPLNQNALDDIEMTANMKVKYMLAELKQINDFINIFYGQTKAISIANEFEQELKKRNIVAKDNIDLEAINSPAVKLVNTIIEQAVSKNASDIHIEPFNGYIRVRIRIDGLLYELIRIDISILSSIITRIKILAKLNIAEHRLPQDGSINIEINDIQLDLRINILPTIYGEKAVIRIFHCDEIFISKNNIGFNDDDLKKFDNLLKNTNGLILVTGPTGSGKSTTLSAAMRDLNNENLNLVSVENPVENIIDGINQINVNYEIGLDFPQILRAILRQDPDIIRIGEIRDLETAAIAIKAAITGHLVFSTLHTNDAVSAVFRLIDMGIEPYMLAASIKGVISQRLVRKLCKCSKEIEISKEEAKLFKIQEGTKIREPVGCNYCNNTGYKGRFAVYEIFTLNEEIRQSISKNIDYSKLKDLALKNGMISIYDNTIKNIVEQKTSLAEFYRVIYSQ